MFISLKIKFTYFLFFFGILKVIFLFSEKLLEILTLAYQYSYRQKKKNTHTLNQQTKKTSE